VITKDLCTYAMIFLRLNKILRDHRSEHTAALAYTQFLAVITARAGRGGL
jgi:hypothetical protein